MVVDVRGTRTPVTIGIYGTPRSGSTILCSFFNSIERCVFVGEPHRSTGILRIPTRFGDIAMHIDNCTNDIIAFGRKRSLLMCGYKEVYAPGTPNLLNEVMVDDARRLTFAIGIFRDPIKSYSSVVALGHRARGARNPMSPQEFCGAYRDIYTAVSRASNGILLTYEYFIEDPIGYINTKFPFEISGALNMLPNQVRGGDPHAIKATEIKKVDSRIPYPRHRQGELKDAISIYKEVSRT